MSVNWNLQNEPALFNSQGTVVGVADLINFEFLFLLLQNGIWTILTCKKIFGAWLQINKCPKVNNSTLFWYTLLIKMTNIAGLCRLMKKIPDNNSNVTNSMVLVWYWELLRALRYKLIWGGELDLSPPKLDHFCIKNSKKEKEV